jgi:signal transduction histidine kinase
MGWQQTPYTIPLLISGALCGAVAAYAAVHYRRHKRDRMLLSFSVMTGLAAVLSIHFAIVTSRTSFLVQRTGYFVTDVVILALPLAWLVFALEYTGREHWITRRRLALAAIVPLGISLGIVSDFVGLTAVHYPEFALVEAELGYVYAERTFGPVEWANSAYTFALVIGGAMLLVHTALSREDIYRGQATALIVGAIAPIAVNALYMAPVGPEYINPTKIGFGVTALAFWVAITRYRLLHVVPVARTSAITTMSEGYLVLDTRDRVVDLNPSCAGVFDIDDHSAAIGRSLGEVAASAPALDGCAGALARYEPGDEAELEVTTGDQTGVYRVQVSRLRDSSGRQRGRLFLFHDITALRRRQEELERQNSQLDQFASVVSHDLRNPLSVAQGFTDLAVDNEEFGHLDRVHNAHDRMQQIIDDLLTLSREGQTVDETEPVALSHAAESAWQHVETGDVVFDDRAEAVVSADPNRLLRLLENCFRNAIEHADPTTIRVGSIEDEDGFFVADDGCGIPEDDRETVLEHGYTTNDDGTGLGLSIVDSIASAHGWETTVTESPSGGARFEFTDVVLSDEQPSEPPLSPRQHETVSVTTTHT